MKCKRSALAMILLLAPACGGGNQSAPPPIQTMTAADEVLRVSDVWTSVQPNQGILSPPSKISMFRGTRSSEIRLTESSATERFTIEEEVELRSGGKVRCRTTFEHALALRWGRKAGEPAVELTRPALSGARSCDGIHPDGDLSEPALRALMVLRSDQLVVIEPLVDQRKFLPTQM